MKKHLLLLILIFIFPINALSFDFDLYSNNALLYHLDENKIIYEKNINENIKIASLTKVMTTIVALEHIENLKETLIVEGNILKTINKSAALAGFRNNEIITYEDLLYGSMLPSGADATTLLAYNLFGSEKEFVNKMNDLAKNLNLENTYFTNASGLNDNKQENTLSDYLKIMLYALQNEDFKTIFFTKEYETTNKRLLFKSNLLYFSEKYNLDTSIIKGAKTGYTNEAGLCIVSIAKHNDGCFLLITTGAPTKNLYPYHIIDSLNIYNYYFNNYSNFNILKQNQIITKLPTSFSKEKDINLIYKDQDLTLYLPNKNNISYEYNLPKKINFNQNILNPAGTINIYLDDSLIYTKNLYIENKLTFSFIEVIKNYWFIFLIVPFIIIRKRKNKII